MSADVLSKNILPLAMSLIDEHGMVPSILQHGTSNLHKLGKMKVPNYGENFSLTLYVLQVGVYYGDVLLIG